MELQSTLVFYMQMVSCNVIIINTIEIKKDLALPLKDDHDTGCWKPVTLIQQVDINAVPPWNSYWIIYYTYIHTSEAKLLGLMLLQSIINKLILISHNLEYLYDEIFGLVY